MFNHAATDLNDKGIINLKKYSRYLSKNLNQCKMEYPIDQKMSENDFVQLLADKANMLKKHLKTTQSDLVICANIGQIQQHLNFITSKKRTR